MDVRDLAAQHDALTERFKLYEQRVGQLPPVELMEHRSYLSAAIPEIARLQEKRDRDERGLRRRQWMMLVGGVIAGLVLKIPWNLL